MRRGFSGGTYFTPPPEPAPAIRRALSVPDHSPLLDRRAAPLCRADVSTLYLPFPLR